MQGTGLIVVGGKEEIIRKDSVIVIPSNIAHFTIAKNNLVLAVVNTPPFNPQHYYALNQENKAVQFNKAQLDKLVQQCNSKNRLNNHESKTHIQNCIIK